MHLQAAVLALVTGCTAPGPVDPAERPPLALEIGQEFVVVDRPVMARSAALGPDGNVHLLALSRDDHSLHHIVIAPPGAATRSTTIARGLEVDDSPVALPGPYNNLTTAFDADGTLHAVFRRQHWSFRAGNWSEPEESPPCERLVRAGSTLHCLYRETGGEHGAAMRLQWYFIPPSPVPIPIPHRNTKLLVACRSSTAWITWAIVEPQEGRDVAGYAAGGEGSGSLQVIYKVASTTNLLGGAGLVMVARTPSVAACDEDLRRRGVTGVPGFSTGMGISRGSFSIATDPSSARSLALITDDYGYVHSLMLADGAIADKQSNIWKHDPMKEDYWSTSLAAAGNGSFHALYTTNRAPTHYLMYAAGKWSQPAQVFPTRTMFLVSQSATRALVIGPSAGDKQLIARWLTVSP